MSFCEFRRFLRETAGNYAIMFAIAAFPIMGTISLAIEYSSIQRERSAVQQSLDAATLTSIGRRASAAGAVMATISGAMGAMPQGPAIDNLLANSPEVS